MGTVGFFFLQVQKLSTWVGDLPKAKIKTEYLLAHFRPKLFIQVSETQEVDMILDTSLAKARDTSNRDAEGCGDTTIRGVIGRDLPCGQKKF